MVCPRELIGEVSWPWIDWFCSSDMLWWGQFVARDCRNYAMKMANKSMVSDVWTESVNKADLDLQNRFSRAPKALRMNSLIDLCQ